MRNLICTRFREYASFIKKNGVIPIQTYDPPKGPSANDRPNH